MKSIKQTFWPNGKLYSEVHYTYEVREGPYRQYYASGSHHQSRIDGSDSEHDGIVRGQLKEESQYVND